MLTTSLVASVNTDVMSLFEGVGFQESVLRLMLTTSLMASVNNLVTSLSVEVSAQAQVDHLPYGLCKHCSDVPVCRSRCSGSC